MIQIEVFGVKEAFPTKEGGCGSPNGCDITLTIGEQYEFLKNFLEKRYVLSKVDLKFIDVRYIDRIKFKDIMKLIDTGFSMPYVFINGKLRFFGAIPEKAIYEEINKCLELP